MRVDTSQVNLSFQSLIEHSEQDIFLDANFFIPPDRSHFGMKPYRVEDYREFWLEPLFSEFDGLSIHESVYDELVMGNVKQYADANTKSADVVASGIIWTVVGFVITSLSTIALRIIVT